MLTQIVFQTIYKGEQYVESGITYALCDGQSVPRGNTGLTPAIWPSGMYGSTTDTVVLPDYSQYCYLRGTDLGRGEDPDNNARTQYAPGTGPTASGIGSYQTGSFATHTHPDGNPVFETPVSKSNSSNQNFFSVNSAGAFNTSDTLSTTTNEVAPNSNFDPNAVEPDHHYVYPYIQIK